MQTTRPQLPALTGLRAVAAYSVLLAHCIAASYAGTQFLPGMATRLAYFGMSLFFVLSGFVIDYNYAEKIQTGRDVWRFFVARFARLYPLYAIVILLAIPYRPQIVSAGLLAAYATMTQSWVNMEEAFAAYTWSISTEWFFYVAFIALIPLIAMIRRPGKTLRVYLVATAVLLFCIFLAREKLTDLFAPRLDHGPASNLFWLWLTYYSPYIRVFEFGAGVLASRIYKSGGLQISSRSAVLAAVWCVAVLLAGGILNDSIATDYLPNFVYAPALAVIVLHVSQTNGAGRLFAAPAFVFLGEISYSVYLLQAYGRTAALGLVGDTIFAIFLTLFFVTAIATVSFFLIEKPAKLAINRVLHGMIFDSRKLRALKNP